MAHVMDKSGKNPDSDRMDADVNDYLENCRSNNGDYEDEDDYDDRNESDDRDKEPYHVQNDNDI